MIKVNTKKLNAALAIASRCCHTGAIPILSMVHIEGKGDGRLHLASSNLDMSVCTSLEAHVEEAGAVCIHGRHITRIVGALDTISAETTLTIGKSLLHVASGPSKFKLLGVASVEFPKLPEMPNKTTKLKQVELRKLLEAVANAQSDDASRHILNGSYVVELSGKLHAIATDGRRLHVCAAGASGIGESGVIMPAKCVDHLISLLGDEGDVTVAIDERSRLFAVIDAPDGQITFISKLTEGNYPNWRLVVPKDHTLEVELNRDEFRAAVRRVSLALDDKNRSMRFKIEGMSMRLTGYSAENGEADETIACTSKAVDTMFALNPGFMLDALNGSDSEKVTLKLSDKSPEVSPIVVINGPLTSVIMPVRLS